MRAVGRRGRKQIDDRAVQGHEPPVMVDRQTEEIGVRHLPVAHHEAERKILDRPIQIIRPEDMAPDSGEPAEHPERLLRSDRGIHNPGVR